MIHEDIVKELVGTLRPNTILSSLWFDGDGETPFGYVLTYIRDMYGLPKTEGWDTAMEVCKQLGFKV